MITYIDIRPGDTFARADANGFWELRRIMADGSSEFVKRLDAEPDRPAR